MEKSNQIQPRCPRCRQLVDSMGDRLYWCAQCKMMTDCEDDGDIGYMPQDRYAERKEAYEIRQRNREREQAKSGVDKTLLPATLESEGRMTHKDGEWTWGPVVTPGPYWFGGHNKESPVNPELIIYRGTNSSDGWRCPAKVEQCPPVPVPRPEAVDTPVLVRNKDDQPWLRRYLAGWAADGTIKAWGSGATSWSAVGGNDWIRWNQWKLPEET